MSAVQTVRALVEQRLTAAAQEIFGLFERTIAEYEEELSRSKEENERQQKLLDAVFSPQLQLHRADVQQLSRTKEQVPPQHQDQDQEEPEPPHIKEDQDQDQEEPEPPHIKEDQDQDQEEPEPPHVKEEQEELWSSQEGEQQLQGLEEADITKFTFTPVPVKSEDDGEKPQSSQLHQTHTEHMETEAAGEDCGGPGPHRDPGPHLQPQTDIKASDSSETEVSDDDWKETRDHQSGLESLNNNDVPVSALSFIAGKKTSSCSECGETFGRSGSLKRHMRSHTGEKPFSCSVCQKQFLGKTHLKVHMMTHTGERPFSCLVCGKTYKQKVQLTQHMARHSGEKPFSCSLCGKGFIRKSIFQLHIKSHAGGKPFSCFQCGKSFILMTHLTQHMRIHTGEKLFSCTVCAERFTSYSSLKTHRCPGGRSEENKEPEPPASSSTRQIHLEADGEDCGAPEPDWNSDPDSGSSHRILNIEDFSELETDYSNKWKEATEAQSVLNPLSDSRCREKLFCCSECGKIFCHNGNLKRHMRSHTGEKPFSCSFCKKSFRQSGHLQRHLRIHMGEKPFSCSECGKIFGTSGSLKRHVITHTGEKPFSCSFCHKSFTRNVSLQLHLRFHTGKKLFSCLICGKSFSQAGNLSQHMIHIHTRKKPLSCSV